MKFSVDLIHKAIMFSQACVEELGDMADEKIEAMFDAFDPGLKREILMLTIKGEVSGTMRVRSSSQKEKYKINAIKAVRMVCGLGLKEAKDIVDSADANGFGVINGTWTFADRRQLKAGLEGTGYFVD